MGATLFCSVFLIASGKSEIDFLAGDERRDLDGDDFECPYKEEKLFYNIDIFIEGIGEGCGTYDLYDIGTTLQEIVDEVEEDIPEYKQREKMETVMYVCCAPGVFVLVVKIPFSCFINSTTHSHADLFQIPCLP